MATKTQKIKVGVFLVVCAAMLTGGLALISGYRGGGEVAYEIIFSGSVLGLYEGGLVQYRGVEVGRVDAIHVGDDHQAHVRILVDPAAVRLTQGVQAKLEIFSLATGTMCVALSGGECGGPPLDPAVPIIAEPSLVESFSNSIGGLNEDLSDIIARINTGLEGMEEGDLAEIVERIKDIAEQIDTGLEGMEEGELSDLVRDVKDVVAEIKKGLEGMDEGEVADLIAGVKDIVDQVKKGLEGIEGGELADTLAGIRDVVAEVRKGLEGMEPGELAGAVDHLNDLLANVNEFLESASTAVDETTRTTVHTADNLQHALAETLQALNEAADAIRDLADYLEEDPSAVFRGKGRPEGGE
ncbi:MAG: MCE family protein [Candidatus Hydrogenedentes bacterium]|nr:MCE family protein [Candidatus Hydrogenedentota bacterium]